MRFLIIFIFLISNSLATEVKNIKNLVINKNFKKYADITFLNTENKLIKLNDYNWLLPILII